MSRGESMGVLLGHAQDKIALLDEEGRFTYVNEAVESILGYEPSDLVGRDSFEFVHPEDVETVRTTFRETIASEEFEESTVEYRFRAADGSWVWFESRMSNLTDEELDGYVVSSRDVTDRVQAQRERRETATRLQEIAATADDVLWMFDGDWSELLFVNPSYETVYGRPVAELEGDPQTFLETIHPDDVSAVERAMARLSAGESVDMEYRVDPTTDYDTWVWVQAEPVVEDGDVVRIVGFTRDVTERRQRERQLYVMDNLLRHNLRNDLGVILGNAELIEEEAPEVADHTAVIRQTGEDLLASADKERRIIELVTTDATPTEIDLTGAVRESVASARERFPEARVELICPDGVTCRALGEMGLAVVELVENAIVHADHDDPWVSVTVTPGDETVTVEVADDGAPIPEMETSVLAGEYGTSEIYHSSGLGLWLVYWTVDLSGGEVSVETDDEGNRVRLALPAG